MPDELRAERDEFTRFVRSVEELSEEPSGELNGQRAGQEARA
jgi:hypothetical protein